ncbi:MAG: hypothetical protein OZ917_06895 [Candidatus Brocadiaceae bacterium]|nr:hypothetical protein [Candidatus Brocadiaceae bacterium]
MSKTNHQHTGYAKLIDCWSPPPEAGEPIGCVATTYTFSPVFFEEDCLSRFLKMESDPNNDGSIFVFEREEKMASVECISVLVDQHYCKGARSLRWDIISARIPKAIMHAKISILYWSNLVRVIVGSANLTEEGYRKNQEIFGSLDFQEGSDIPVAVLKSILDFLKEMVDRCTNSPDQPEVRRWHNFITNIEKRARNWGRIEPYRGGKDIRIYPLLIGTEKPNLFDQVRNYWNEASSRPPEDAWITSPFFDPPDSSNIPAKRIWEVLNQRGMACVCYYVRAVDNKDEKQLIINAPESLLKSVPNKRSSVKIRFTRLTEMFDTKETREFRPLHMKSIWFQNDEWVLYVIGSSNFTTSGTGVGSTANFEANIVYMASRAQNKAAVNVLEKSSLSKSNKDDLVIDEYTVWDRQENEDERDSECLTLLPSVFDYAIYGRNDQIGAFVRFHFSSQDLPKGFSILQEEGKKVFYDERKWIEDGKLLEVTLKWKYDLPPSGFNVIWDGAKNSSWWPVNIESASALPPSPELKDIPLEILMAILTSARPLHQVIGVWLKKKQQFNKPDVVTDPRKKVDTTKFLFQRTRQISWVLRSLKERLERPFYTVESLQWRLRGPIGVLALIQTILREGKSEGEKAFLVAEIVLELGRINPKEDTPKSLKREDVIEELHKIIREIRETILPHIQISDDLMNTYLSKAFRESLK